MISQDSCGSTQVQEGIYQIGHFGMSDFLPNHYPHPALTIDNYGVCDNFQQVLDRCPEVEANPNRKFLITLTPIVKVEQPSDGGWRWHKWGDYIGDHEVTMEYLYDEPSIEKVYVYHIYEEIQA